jgi:hypothetical protein
MCPLPFILKMHHDFELDLKKIPQLGFRFFVFEKLAFMVDCMTIRLKIGYLCDSLANRLKIGHLCDSLVSTLEFCSMALMW